MVIAPKGTVAGDAAAGVIVRLCAAGAGPPDTEVKDSVAGFATRFDPATVNCTEIVLVSCGDAETVTNRFAV